jgi:hypothetical protein
MRLCPRKWHPSNTTSALFSGGSPAPPPAAGELRPEAVHEGALRLIAGKAEIDHLERRLPRPGRDLEHLGFGVARRKLDRHAGRAQLQARALTHELDDVAR